MDGWKVLKAVVHLPVPRSKLPSLPRLKCGGMNEAVDRIQPHNVRRCTALMDLTRVSKEKLVSAVYPHRLGVMVI